MSKMNRRNNRFLSDKLRYTKRTTTKREFSFIPIPLGRGERGDAAAGEREQTFALSPPKWASSPRDTPKTSERKKKKLHVDISLIEPISRLKLSGPKTGTEQEDPTINLAALRAAELQVQKQSAEEKAPPQEDPPPQSRVKLTRDPIRSVSNEKEPRRSLQNLANVQSEEKEEDPNVQDAETNSTSTSKTRSSASKWSTKVQGSSDNNSDKLGRKKRRSSVSSKDSEPQRSKSRNRSSAEKESANEVHRSSKVGSNKDSSSKSHRSRSGSRSSGLEELLIEGPKSSKIDSYKNSGLKSRGSRRSSRSSVVEDSENEVRKSSAVDPGPGAQRSRRSSRSSVVEDSENEVPKSSKIDSYKNSGLKSHKSRSGRRSSVVEDSEDEVPQSSKVASYKNSKVSKETGGYASEGFSSREKRSKNQDEVGAVSDGKASNERRISRKSRGSSAGSAKSSDVDRLSRGKSSDSDKKSGSGRKKSIEVLRKFEDLVAASLPALKKPRKSSGSEKSADEVKSRSRKKSESEKDLPDIDVKSGTSGKSPTRVKKPSARSSSSEKPATGGPASGKKRGRRSSSLEKSPRGRAIRKKPITRSSSSEISPGEGPSNRKVPRKSIALESSGDRPPKSRKMHTISQAKSNRSKYSRRSVSEKFARQPYDMDSSSDDQLFSPQKLRGANQPIGSKKGALFKKAVKSMPKKKGAFQSSGVDASSDEQLFSPQKRKVPDQQISSEEEEEEDNREKPEMEIIKPSKSDKNQFPKTFKDVSGEMSEEIPLQDKPLITTFAGLPLSDDEKLSTDENPDDVEKERLEENILNLEDIMELKKDKLDRSYDTSRGLKLNMLQPLDSTRSRPARSVTDLDVLWDFLGKSLRVVIRGTADEEKRLTLQAMKSFLEEHFLGAMSKQLKKKDMESVLKAKTDEIKILTNRLLYYKQKNRLFAQKIYEKGRAKSPQKEVAVMDKFEDFCQTFTQFKRN